MSTDDLMDDNKIRQAQEEASEAAKNDVTENDEKENSDEVNSDEVKKDATVASDEKEDQKQVELNNDSVFESLRGCF